MLGAVAKRYAEALFQVALEQGRMQEIDAQAQPAIVHVDHLRLRRSHQRH